MKSSRSDRLTAKPSLPPQLARQPPAPLPGEGGPIKAWVRFWFRPADPIALHVVRLLAGLLVVAWLLPFAGHLEALFGPQGWFDQQAYRDAARMRAEAGEAATMGFPFDRPIGWWVLALVGRHPALLTGFYWLSVGVAALLAAGVWPRLTAPLTWGVAVAFTGNPVIASDADVLLNLLAFYLMIGYLGLDLLGQDLPVWRRLVGPLLVWPAGWLLRSPDVGPQPSTAANVALRLLQVHLAIVIVTSGLHKLQFPEWWAGGALWFPLHQPFETKFEEVLKLKDRREFVMGLLSLTAYLALAWQIGFPLYAWRRYWRPALLGGAVLGWVGTALFYRLPLYGPAILVGCFGYVSPEEWRRLFAWLSRIAGLRAQAPAAGYAPPAFSKERVADGL